MIHLYNPTQSKSFVAAFGRDYDHDSGNENHYTEALETLYPMDDDLADQTQESLNNMDEPSDRDWLIRYMAFYFEKTGTHLEWGKP